jgi:dTMP kinase
MMPARFITLEGIEGAGKTTVADRITRALRARGITIHATREPGGTKVAERIRALVLDRGEEHIAPTAETLLMFGARQVHLDNLIRPALARGEWVLCDRFTDATHAYQGGGRGVNRALIEQLAQAVHGDLYPDCTILLDVPVRVGLERMQARRGAIDRFEVESAQFFDRVRNRYLELARAAPQRFRVVDATVDLDRVCDAAMAALDEALKLEPASVENQGPK